MENVIINDDFRNHLNLFQEPAYIISDPPYNQKYHYGTYKDDLQIEEYIILLNDAFGGYKSVIIHYPEETINIVARAMSADWCEDSVAWVYPSNTAKQHRQITWWNCKPDFRKISQPYKNPTDKRIAKRIAEGKTAKGYDWWEINQVKNVSKKNNPHPCPIPYEVAKRIILATTQENDLVIDPFMGSGTIVKAAKDLGRRFLGFDIDKTYVDYANEQLKQENKSGFFK